MKFKRPGLQQKQISEYQSKLEEKAGKLQEKEQELEQMTKNVDRVGRVAQPFRNHKIDFEPPRITGKPPIFGVDRWIEEQNRSIARRFVKIVRQIEELYRKDAEQQIQAVQNNALLDYRELKWMQQVNARLRDLNNNQTEQMQTFLDHLAEPSVRYRGRTFIRIGPRRDIATEAEERILAERRMSFMATFDSMPCLAVKLNDVNTDLLRTKYLIPLLGNELVESDTRPIEEQMAAVGMYDTEHQCPTYAAVVLFGNNPRRFMPGLYVQYVCFKGEDVTSEVENEMQLEGNYCELLPRLESLLELSVIKKKPVFVSILREEMVSNYPYQAIRELLLNACMHRDMQSNTPLRFYEFACHLEILNAGGLYGNARPENFPSVNDYRNPLVASAMKTLGYVNMFNRGVGQVQTDLKENGNQPAEFNVNLITAFKVDVRVSQSYTNENGGKVGGDVVENIVENIAENIIDSIVEKLSTTRAKIVRIIWKNPNATAQSISKEINIASRNVQEHLRKLQEQGVIRRIGSDKGGHWEIIAP